MTPSIGRIVHYMLSETDAVLIEGGRNKEGSLNRGNRVKAGDVFPMMIVRVWGDSEVSSVQGQVFLDGNDCYWATSRGQVVADSVDKQGLWFAPPRTP